MAYPQELLSPGESVIHEVGSHWSVLWKEALGTVAYLLLLILLVPDGVNGWGFTIITLLWLWIAVGGYIGWRASEHVITTERLIDRGGLVRKIGHEIPLEVINEVTFRQNLIQRAIGVADLIIEFAGSRGQSRMSDLPEPERLKSLIDQARRNRTNSMSVARPNPAPSPAFAPAPVTATSSGKSSAEQLEILGRLFDQGKLTQSEYDTEKRKLLG